MAGLTALACEMPAASGTHPARWTCPELARHAAADGIAPAPLAATVRRWLVDDAIKPWQHQPWIFPRDPRFALKASRVLDLYQREWEDQLLGEDDYVLSSDEKPGTQASVQQRRRLVRSLVEGVRRSRWRSRNRPSPSGRQSAALSHPGPCCCPWRW